MTGAAALDSWTPAVGTAGEPAWLLPRRREALARFESLGFPTTRLEDWKYTNVAKLVRTEHRLGAPGRLPEARLSELVAANLPGERAVFVNGHASASAAGAHLFSLDDAPACLEEHLARVAEVGESAFAALNTASFQDVACVHVPAGDAAPDPLHLVHVAVPGALPTVSHPRTLVVLERGASAVLVEEFVGEEGGSFTNSVTEVVLGENARLELVRLQRGPAGTSHVSCLEARLARDAQLSSHALCLSGDLVRNDLAVHLGSGAEVRLLGLFLGEDESHVDNQTLVDHAEPGARSDQLYKGILADASRGVFRGRVLVRQDAQHTSADQQNRNLLLSAGAEIDTKPQLEILADDVRCSHGSTIGSIDAEALFYLRSRGIPQERARAILTHAFGAEILAALPLTPLRESLSQTLLERFTRPQEASP